jgi:hypothetical protein
MQYGDIPPLSATRFSPPRTRTSSPITEWTIPESPGC